MSDLLAQTRLGLHVTREELTIWRQRAASGPYKNRSDVSENSPDDWNRIEKNAQAFKASPASFRWGGPTLLEGSGRVKKGTGDDVRLQNEPNGKALAHHIRDAAFVALVDENRSDRKQLKQAVKAELLQATSIRSLDFTNRTFWPETYFRDINPLFQTMNWFNNYLFAYDYIDISDKLTGENTFSSEERKRIDNWLLAAAEFAQHEQDWDINRNFTNRSSSPADAAYTPARKWSPSQRGGADLLTHYSASGPGHTVYGIMQTFNNRRMACYRYAALVGIKLGKTQLVESAKRYVKDWIKYSVFTDGTMGEMERWSGSIPDLGWAYCTDVIASAVSIADALARKGDHSLYEYNTSIGLYGTEGIQGQSKNLHKTLKMMHKVAAKQVKWYGTNKKSNLTSSYLIDGETSSWKALHDVWLTMANLKYKDQDIQAMYMRKGEGMSPYWSRPVGQGKHVVWTGDWGIFPGLLFMFGQMEEQKSPYTNSSVVNNPVTIPLSISTTTKPILCYGQASGSAVVSATGGVPPYSYLWSNGATTPTLDKLPAGAYTVTVTDAAGSRKMASLSLSQPAALALQQTLSPETSTGRDGAISLTVTGGTGSYSYLWSTGATTKDLTGLAAGDYQLTLTDANGCQLSKTFTLARTPAAPLLLSLSAKQPECNGLANGSIQASVSGGVAPYSYLWSTGKTSPLVEDLLAGSYSLTVSDAQGTQTAASLTLQQPQALLIQDRLLAESTAGGDGSISLSVSGGTAPYSYLWSTGATTQTLSALPAGIYQVRVTDAKGCQQERTFVLEQAPAAALLLTYRFEPARCYGTASGSIALSVSGGVAPYGYLWSNGATSPELSGLLAGNYQVTVTDAQGSEQRKTILLSQASPLQISYSATAQHLPQEDGSIRLSVSGGTAPYSYLWSTGATTQTLSDLTAGSYQVSVRDAYGCQVHQTIQVKQTSGQPATAPLTLTSSSKALSCYGQPDGAVAVAVTGGVPPYSYQWSNGALSPALDQLPTGSYTVTVTDAAGSTKTASLTLSQPQALQLSGQVSPASAQSSDGSIRLSVSGGTPPYRYEWSTGASTPDLSGLAAGSYQVSVTDQNGCRQQTGFELSSLPPVARIQSISLLNAENDQVLATYHPLQEQDTINLALLPSRLLNLRANTSQGAIERVEFVLNGAASRDLTAPFYLQAQAGWRPGVGAYQLIAIPYTKGGQKGESYQLNFYVIDQPQVANGQGIEPLLGCVQENGDGTLTATLGYVNHNPFRVELPRGAANFLSLPVLQGELPESFEPGTHRQVFTLRFAASEPLAWKLTGPDGRQHSLQLSSRSPLCTPQGEPLKPRIVFSPNQDGIDDLWQIDNIEQYPGYELLIYNRQGTKVFEAGPYQNNWDGTFQGKPLMAEAYYFVIKDEQGTIQTGSVTLIR